MFHYGYSDFSPRKWSIAVPRTASCAVKNIEDQEEFLRRLEKCKYAENLVLTIEQFEQVIGFADDKVMQKKWKAFTRKIDTKTGDFSTVLKTIKVFLTKPFTAAVEGKAFIDN